MKPQGGAQNKSFYPMLIQWGTKGVTVNCNADWGWSVIKREFCRETHRSALDLAHASKVHEDIHYQLEARFSQIIPWEEDEKVEARKYEGVTDGGDTSEEHMGVNYTRIILPCIP